MRNAIFALFLVAAVAMGRPADDASGSFAIGCVCECVDMQTGFAGHCAILREAFPNLTSVHYYDLDRCRDDDVRAFFHIDDLRPDLRTGTSDCTITDPLSAVNSYASYKIYARNHRGWVACAKTLVRWKMQNMSYAKLPMPYYHREANRTTPVVAV